MEGLQRPAAGAVPSEARRSSATQAWHGRPLAVLLTLLVAMGPISTDLYLPSLPGIAVDLGASEALVQLTLGLFMAGFGVTMLVCGPIADRFGRRPALLGGMAIYLVASIACALSPDIWSLLGARLVQAIGACSGPVVARAIVRDLHEPREAGRILGYMASAMALAPLIGPFIGGWLEVAFGWRASFWFLTGYGALLLITLWRRLPETRPAPSADAAASRLLGTYVQILHNRTFAGFMMCAALASGALFTWIINSAFVVIDHFGVAPQNFGFAFGVVIAGYVLGAWSGSRAGMRLGLERATAIGVGLAAIAGVGLAIAGWGSLGGLEAIVALSALSFFGTGMAIPQGTAGALGPFPMLAGTASALLGFMQMMAGLLVTALSSAWYDGSPRPMVTLNAVCALAAVAAFWSLLRRPSG